jgi:hypothetical protein
MRGPFSVSSKRALLIILVAAVCLCDIEHSLKFSELWKLLSSSAAVSITSFVVLLHKEEP